MAATDLHARTGLTDQLKNTKGKKGGEEEEGSGSEVGVEKVIFAGAGDNQSSSWTAEGVLK